MGCRCGPADSGSAHQALQPSPSEPARGAPGLEVAPYLVDYVGQHPGDERKDVFAQRCAYETAGLV
eukprot:14305277-Alexandrium_andersonii.AAC.1